MTLIKQDPFDEGRVRFYSNTGYFIHDEDNDVKYYDAAVLKELENDFNFIETTEKIPAPTNGVTVKIQTSNTKRRLNNSIPLNKDTIIDYGDGNIETITSGNKIDHTYDNTETYNLNIQTTELQSTILAYTQLPKEVTIGYDVTSIGEMAFDGCNISKIRCYPTEPPVFESNCFGGCIATVIVPNGCSSAYDDALSDAGGKFTITEENE